jgi:hypothetical protein
MTKNKTGNYFKYAIGEIILVVIGILIALQINNWNQNRIDRNEEKEIIAKLHNDFKENKILLEEFIVNHSNEMDANNELMSLIGASKEELYERNLDSLFFASLTANELAFADNTLKNIMQSGRLNILKNDKITTLLYKWNELSEIMRIRMNKLDEWHNDKYTPYLLTKISFKEMDAIGNYKWSGKSKIKPDYHQLFQEIEFENFLDNSQWLHQQILERCEEIEKLIKEIIKVAKPRPI